ncbi:MAG: glycoside hydrolase family 19 protein, partial [Ignavibacteria bacterium]
LMEKLNKEYFENNYHRVFGRKISEEKKKNIFAITDAFVSDDDMKSLRWLAYILATSMHESNDTFAPVVEGYWIKPETKRVNALYNYYSKNNPGALKTIFPNGRTGAAYYGRGRVVQLTHDFNYKLASLKIYGDLRLYNNPDMIITDAACDMAVTFKGMLSGWFTGYKLEQFFPLGSNKANWAGSRKIINGMDRANLIAGYAMKFYDLLEWVTPPVSP